MVSESIPADGTNSSPRSTILAVSAHDKTVMTTNIAAMNGSNVGPEDSLDDQKAESAPKESSNVADGSSGGRKSPGGGSDVKDASESEDKEKSTPDPSKQGDGSLSPSQGSSGGHLPGYPSHLTPAATGYYAGYPQSQVTPEPPSPGVAGAVVGTYDASFFQQAGAFHTSAFGGPNTPLSPPRATANMGIVPPASPLFPRATSGVAGSAVGLTGGLDGQQQALPNGAAPPSPSLPYMASPPLPGMYQHYAVPGVGSQSSSSPDDGAANTWSDNRNAALQSGQNGYQQSSPQMQGMPMSYGMAVTRSGIGGRAYSFEDAMLPPSALDQQDQQGNPAYSPYSGSQASPVPAGGTLFAHQQQPWGYGGPPPDMYNPPGSPIQPRPTAHPQMGMYAGAMAGGMRPGVPYGQYYPASSPGPPIQTTASNKGPDGANLFIFHIPNHFTNLDMYQLFCPYGNLLSVRIMVEKDTGRSRGFGFVSYDSPESAALAIKELNGFAIGNKRLKVQHKQIRPKDLHNNERDNSHGGFGESHGDGNYSQFSSSLPPSGPMASQNMWYEGRKAIPQHSNADGSKDANANPDEGTELTSTSTGAETPLQYGGSANESPLANLGTLQNALPDVPGNGSVPE